jgi:hypothetical protein
MLLLAPDFPRDRAPARFPQRCLEMRHLVFLVMVVAACGGDDNASSECMKAEDCSGGVCLTLGPNRQNKGGICSSVCSTSCASEDEVCVALTGEQSFCLKRCEDNASCEGGFVCYELPTTAKACYVEPS